MQETLSNAVLVVLAGYLAYLVLETLITRIWLRHVPELPPRNDKTPPGSRARVAREFSRDAGAQEWLGQVKVGGELWAARYRGRYGPQVGDQLQVIERQGLVLKVGWPGGDQEA